MQINYDFPWYLQNSEGFMALYTGLYDVASNISPISLLTALDIEHATTPEQLKLVATLYGLRGDFVAIKDALIYNIKKWSLKGNDLPDGYTELEYIDNNGSAYLDTGIKPNQNTSVRCGYIITRNLSGTAVAFGCTNNASSTQANNGIIRMLSPNRVGWGGTQSGSLVNTTGGTDVDVFYDIFFNKNEVSINDSVIATTTATGNWQADYSIYLFRRNTAGTASFPFGGRIYYFKVWDGDTLVQNLVPCRRESDGVIGMYDTIATENNFIASGNSTDFIGGPDFPGTLGETNYWSGNATETTDLLVNYIKAKVQIRNKNLTLQTLKQFFEVCLAHREFDPNTDISVEESTLHFDLTVSVDEGILNDMVTLLSVDPFPFGKPTGISYTINYVLQN